MKKLALILQDLQMGGVQIVICNLSRHFSSLGHEVHIILLSGKSDFGNLHPVKVHSLARSEKVVGSLRGGICTLDELFGMWTLEALEIDRVPSAVLDDNGFFQALLKFAGHMTATGFLRPAWREQLLIGTQLADLLDLAETGGEPSTCVVTAQRPR